MSATPPPGYLNRKINESIQDALAHYTVDHIKTIVKSAIQRYIQSFMDTDGGNRELFEVVSKMGLQYITDRDFDPSSDPTLRKTQLARLFEQIRQELPCILIMDSAFEYVPMNFTGLDKVWYQNNFWYGRIHIARNMRIMLVAGARDQSSADTLHSILSFLFGELRWLAGGTRITGNRQNGETWAMTMGLPELGKVTQQRVSGDPLDTVWFFDLEIKDILFEDGVVIQQPINQVKFGCGIMNPSPAFLSETPPVIVFPATIPVNIPTKLYINKFQPRIQKVFVSDPNVAIYDPTSMTVTARQLGTFNVQVMIPRLQDNDQYNQQTGATMDVVASQQVRVTAV
jgi:hypothetical protein